MSLFQFYSYIAGSLHVSGPQAHLQESSHSCSHNHWFSICTALVACSVCCHNRQSTWPEQYRHWTNGCVNSCVNSPEDGPVGPKHVEIRQYINKIEIVTSVGFYSICLKDARYKKLKIWRQLVEMCSPPPIKTFSTQTSTIMIIFTDNRPYNFRVSGTRRHSKCRIKSVNVESCDIGTYCLVTQWGTEGLLLRPGCIGPESAQTPILFYSMVTQWGACPNVCNDHWIYLQWQNGMCALVLVIAVKQISSNHHSADFYSTSLTCIF